MRFIVQMKQRRDGSVDVKEELIAGQKYLGIKGFKANIREKSSTGY